jgi:ubiquinone/menaquinone biosynthesis C-methylase UbiE
MKYVYIVFLLLALALITVTAQNMSIFSKATQSGWYPAFLSPVVDTILKNNSLVEVLDIGTGMGTLPQMLIEKDSSLHITGIDIDTAMIEEAKRRCTHQNVSYQLQKMQEALDFPNNHFDAITFCSVLFLVDESTRSNLMQEALRILKPNGKIIILTPLGSKPFISAFGEVWQYPFSWNNFTFPIWKMATNRSARKWQQQNWAATYAIMHHLPYVRTLVFNDNATIETISKISTL